MDCLCRVCVEENGYQLWLEEDESEDEYWDEDASMEQYYDDKYE